MDESRLEAVWLSQGRKATEPPDPAYPDGITIDAAPGMPGCPIELPYPAECVGAWLITCPVCRLRVLITAAGRPDDPRSVRLPCRLMGAS